MSSLIIGVFAALYLIVNTIFWCCLLFPLALIQFILRFREVKKISTSLMTRIAEGWISGNSWGLDFFYRIQWDFQGTENLQYQKSYLVTANHQSWVDIVVIQKALNHKIPFIRFFLKSQLIFVPILGLAWWALGFPFMKRHSKSFLQKHPEKRREDLETTRRACQRFQGQSLSMLNFLEGTRFTEEKHQRQKSPFKNLLNPKSGGLAFVIESMPGQFDSLLDLTIFYPKGAVSFWGLLAGRLSNVVVQIEKISIPPAFHRGRYLEDPQYQKDFQAWISDLWKKKDEKIEMLKKGGHDRPH